MKKIISSAAILVCICISPAIQAQHKETMAQHKKRTMSRSMLKPSDYTASDSLGSAAAKETETKKADSLRSKNINSRRYRQISPSQIRLEARQK